MRRGVPALLVVGAYGVVLAGVTSAVFDLERYQMPKALVLHGVALALVAVGAARRPARGGPVVGLVLAFVAWSALSAVFASNPWLALGAWGVSLSGLVVLMATGSVEAGARDRAAAWIVGAVVLGAALGVLQAYGWEPPWLTSSRPPGGTFGNRNFLAHLSAIVAPALLVGAIGSEKPRTRWLAVTGLALVVLAVVLTRSRAAWLGGAAGLATVLVGLLAQPRSGPGPRTKRLAPVALAITLAAAGAVLLPNALEWSTDSPYVGTLTRLADFRQGSGRGRLIQYRNSLELAAERPLLGVAPGNWFVHYPRVSDPGDPAFSEHLPIPTNPWPSSDWVTFLAERGAPAVLLLLAAGGLACLGGLRRSRREPGVDGLRGTALAAVLVATLVTGLFDAVLLLPAPAYVTAALIGLLLPWRPPGPPRPGGRWVRAGASLLVTVLLVHAALSVAAIRTTASGRDTATLTRAARLAPWDHRLRLLLAERGRCSDAAAARKLMPYHSRPRELARSCTG
jgi:hypothetical protein